MCFSLFLKQNGNLELHLEVCLTIQRNRQLKSYLDSSLNLPWEDIYVIFFVLKISWLTRVLQEKLGPNGRRASFADFAPRVNTGVTIRLYKCLIKPLEIRNFEVWVRLWFCEQHKRITKQTLRFVLLCERKNNSFGLSVFGWLLIFGVFRFMRPMKRSA